MSKGGRTREDNGTCGMKAEGETPGESRGTRHSERDNRGHQRFIRLAYKRRSRRSKKLYSDIQRVATAKLSRCVQQQDTGPVDEFASTE